MRTCTHPNIPHININIFSFTLHKEYIILSIVVLETIFQVQEKIWAPRGSKRLLRWWCAIWACPLNMCPPNAEHSSGQCQMRHSDHTCKIGASDIHACQPLALCKSLMKGAKKRYGFLGYVCSPISSMQPNLLQVFIWLWQYVWSASGYSPLFSTNNNFIIECHPFGACWLECRRDCQAAFFCGRRKVYATIQKGHLLNTSLLEKVIQDVSVKLRFGTNVWPYGPKKKTVYQKKRGFLLHGQCSKGGGFTKCLTNLRELSAHFKARITPRYLRPRTKTGSNVKH